MQEAGILWEVGKLSGRKGKNSPYFVIFCKRKGLKNGRACFSFAKTYLLLLDLSGPFGEQLHQVVYLQ